MSAQVLTIHNGPDTPADHAALIARGWRLGSEQDTGRLRVAAGAVEAAGTLAALRLPPQGLAPVLALAEKLAYPRLTFSVADGSAWLYATRHAPAPAVPSSDAALLDLHHHLTGWVPLPDPAPTTPVGDLVDYAALVDVTRQAVAEYVYQQRMHP